MAVSIWLTETEPAIATAPELPVGGWLGSVLCPAAELPAPPAAAETMLPSARAETFKVGEMVSGALGFSGSRSSNPTPPPSSVRFVSLMNASVLALISL